MLGRTEIQGLRHKKMQPKLNVLSARLDAFVVGVLYWTHRNGKGMMCIRCTLEKEVPYNTVTNILKTI